jgi:hypothetical protein
VLRINRNFFLLSILMMLITFFLGILLKINHFLELALRLKLTAVEVDDYIHFKKKWEWISYALIPTLLLSRSLKYL